jgi:ribosome-binding factor A
MASRRQEKVARVVKEVVSDAIANHLSDPRIAGLVTVTRVEMTPDLRSADVFLSVLAASDAARNKTFAAIDHAVKRIQSLLGSALESKFCPVLHFHKDEHFHKTLETMRLIEEVATERRSRILESEEPDASGV